MKPNKFTHKEHFEILNKILENESLFKKLNDTIKRTCGVDYETGIMTHETFFNKDYQELTSILSTRCTDLNKTLKELIEIKFITMVEIQDKDSPNDVYRMPETIKITLKGLLHMFIANGYCLKDCE
jgi:hypothetical protein